MFQRLRGNIGNIELRWSVTMQQLPRKNCQELTERMKAGNRSVPPFRLWPIDVNVGSNEWRPLGDRAESIKIDGKDGPSHDRSRA